MKRSGSRPGPTRLTPKGDEAKSRKKKPAPINRGDTPAILDRRPFPLPDYYYADEPDEKETP